MCLLLWFIVWYVLHVVKVNFLHFVKAQCDHIAFVCVEGLQRAGGTCDVQPLDVTCQNRLFRLLASLLCGAPAARHLGIGARRDLRLHRECRLDLP